MAAVVSCPNPHGLAARGGVLKNITIPVYMIHDTTGADLAKAVENQNPTWRAAAYEAITNLMNGRFRPVSDFLITLNRELPGFDKCSARGIVVRLWPLIL